MWTLVVCCPGRIKWLLMLKHPLFAEALHIFSLHYEREEYIAKFIYLLFFGNVVTCIVFLQF